MNYLFKYETIETHARAFLPLNISAVGSVTYLGSLSDPSSKKSSDHSGHYFKIFDQWPKLNLGFDVEPEIRILKVI